MSRLVDVYPYSFAFVQYHVSYDGWTTPWGDDRYLFYQGEFTPTAAFDGIDRLVGAVHNVDQQYNIYRVNHFLPERGVGTDVTINLTATHDSERTYTACAQVGIEAGGTAKTMRIYIVQVLDHWPPGHTYHRNTFKQAAPTVDITLSPGGSQTVEGTFTLDDDSWAQQEDVKFVAWAQLPNSPYPAYVFQSAVRVWPLISYPGDDDGDGVQDVIDNCPRRYNPGQEDTDSDGVGDACDNCPSLYNPDQTDSDEDGFGDVCDNCPLLHSIDQTDTDGDGIGDPCDSCPAVTGPAGVDGFGRPLGAIDLDCDVDIDDLVLFAGCMGGPQVTTPPAGCTPEQFARADVDHDGDVDIADLIRLAPNFTGPLPSPALYVGATSCSACHTGNYGDWHNTIHRTAFDTLVAGGDGENVLCYPCHSVGYGSRGGFVNLQTTPQLAGVQCENCHGPGSNHVVDPNNVSLTVDMSSNLCGACHQSCHGLCGEDQHPQFEQWSTSKHAAALFDLWAEPDAADECLQCHSTEYRLAPEGSKPTLWEVMLNLDCVACHSPHGGPNVGQLRQPPKLLCAECHTMGTASLGDEPKQPQTEELHGIGGYKLDGTEINGPYSEHWWGIPNECSICHVHMEPYGGPSEPADSGHTFLPSMKACSPCHSETAATLLVAMTREEIETRLSTVAHYFTPGDPLYLDPEGIPPWGLAEYQAAKFDYELVQADRSYGAHDADYARALLAQTEQYLGLDPWPLRRTNGPYHWFLRLLPSRYEGEAGK